VGLSILHVNNKSIAAHVASQLLFPPPVSVFLDLCVQISAHFHPASNFTRNWNKISIWNQDESSASP